MKKRFIFISIIILLLLTLNNQIFVRDFVFNQFTKYYKIKYENENYILVNPFNIAENEQKRYPKYQEFFVKTNSKRNIWLVINSEGVIVRDIELLSKIHFINQFSNWNKARIKEMFKQFKGPNQKRLKIF